MEIILDYLGGLHGITRGVPTGPCTQGHGHGTPLNMEEGGRRVSVNVM